MPTHNQTDRTGRPYLLFKGAKKALDPDTSIVLDTPSGTFILSNKRDVMRKLRKYDKNVAIYTDPKTDEFASAMEAKAPKNVAKAILD